MGGAESGGGQPWGGGPSVACCFEDQALVKSAAMAGVKKVFLYYDTNSSILLSPVPSMLA